MGLLRWLQVHVWEGPTLFSAPSLPPLPSRRQTSDAPVRRSMAGVFGIAAAAASQTGDSGAVAEALRVLVHYITLGPAEDARLVALDLR